MPPRPPDPRVFAAGRTAASVDRERALARLSHRRGILLWGLANGWSVRPGEILHPTNGEPTEGWLWRSPDGREHVVAGRHRKVPTVPEAVYAEILAAYDTNADAAD